MFPDYSQKWKFSFHILFSSDLFFFNFFYFICTAEVEKQRKDKLNDNFFNVSLLRFPFIKASSSQVVSIYFRRFFKISNRTFQAPDAMRVQPLSC